MSDISANTEIVKNSNNLSRGHLNVYEIFNTTFEYEKKLGSENYLMVENAPENKSYYNISYICYALQIYRSCTCGFFSSFSIFSKCL